MYHNINLCHVNSTYALNESQSQFSILIRFWIGSNYLSHLLLHQSHFTMSIFGCNIRYDHLPNQWIRIQHLLNGNRILWKGILCFCSYLFDWNWWRQIQIMVSHCRICNLGIQFFCFILRKNTAFQSYFMGLCNNPHSLYNRLNLDNKIHRLKSFKTVH